MKKILFALILCLTASTVFCQGAAKNIFAELGGIGGVSLNYDTRFTQKTNGIGGRIGFGAGFGYSSLLGFVAPPDIFIPTQLNYLIGKDGKNYFELGAGVTFVIHPYIVEPSDYNTDRINIYDQTFGHLNVAYRRQPSNGGFFFKVAYNPLFGSGVVKSLNIGLSIGYTFKSHK